MQTNSSYIDLEKIRKLLYDDAGFIQEFSEAAAESFKEFSEDYEKYLLSREEKELRKAGHKVKPVALMIGVDKVVDEYENAKKLLHENATDAQLEESVSRVNKITAEVIGELRQLYE